MADRQLQIPEIVVPDQRLGRNVRHDPRSLAYRVESRGIRETARWERKIPVQLQGNLGRCVPTSAIGCLGTEPFYSSLPPTIQELITDDMSFQLYREATQIDPFPGSWEPDDTGSDGLSVAKVLHARGWISGYQHITSLEAAWTAITRGPFITGVIWTADMDEPDANGVVRATGRPRGGHEFLVTEYDAATSLWGCWNSWGENWAQGGKFYMHDDDYRHLLAMQGDATVFIPRSAPAPQPASVVNGGPLADFPFIELDDWAAHKRYWWNKRNVRAADAYSAWRASKMRSNP